jgi:hypothetical protein
VIVFRIRKPVEGFARIQPSTLKECCFELLMMLSSLIDQNLEFIMQATQQGIALKTCVAEETSRHSDSGKS